eukprot:363159-Chlamydomonas_euryale.AAC.12
MACGQACATVHFCIHAGIDEINRQHINPSTQDMRIFARLGQVLVANIAAEKVVVESPHP